MKFTEGMWRLQLQAAVVRHAPASYGHFEFRAGVTDKGPRIQLNTFDPEVTTMQLDNEVHLQSGKLMFRVNTGRNTFSAVFRDGTMTDSENLTSHSRRSVGYVRDERSLPRGEVIAEGSTGHMFMGLDLDVDERIYGLGERFGPFVLNGQAVEMFNDDGGSSSQLAYKNIPFFMSSKGYGVFVNHPGRVSFEVQSERMTRVNISVPGQTLEYFLIYGMTPAETMQKYTAMTGRPALPPSWTYQLWLTTSFITNYDERTVHSFVDGFQVRNIPLGTFWCDFQFNKELFPDAQGLVSSLKDRGLKVSLWINPYIAQESDLFDEGKSRGFFLKRTNGDIFQWDNWQAGQAIVDFTNPEARSWYQHKLSQLLSMGVDSFKSDFGERIPTQGVKYYDGSDPELMHNYYTLLYTQTVHEVLQRELGPTGGCLFARSATAGSQQYPVHWGGDSLSSFGSMAETLRGGLSAAISGIGFWAHDIGGFDGTPSPSLYKRWCQFGLLSSHSRLHGADSYRVPWEYGEEACDVLRDCVKRKMSLMPYILHEALVTHKTGIPMMRPLFFEFPNDVTAQTVQTQYFFGGNLLVSPVFLESNRVKFYVPESEGLWVSWFDMSKRYIGGRWYTEEHTVFSLPLLIRPGSVTVINPTATDKISEMNKSMELFINGPIQEMVRVDVIDAERPDTIARTVRVTAENEGKCLLIDLGDNPGMTWSVLYFGNAAGGEENNGFKKYVTGESKLSIVLE
ncbi:hypothetical protein KEM54_005421 [Ascosphaera aggregata]|nr:hypothetical protein KEM54_005421 [Ascosphaera aggregata]